MTDQEIKAIRDEEAVRIRVRTELAESSGYDNKIEIANGIKVTGFDMPFLHMVGFLVKLSLAAIPAAIILAIIYFLLVSFLFGALR
jgi:hypothetical protein